MRAARSCSSSASRMLLELRIPQQVSQPPGIRRVEQPQGLRPSAAIASTGLRVMPAAASAPANSERLYGFWNASFRYGRLSKQRALCQINRGVANGRGYRVARLRRPGGRRLRRGPRRPRLLWPASCRHILPTWSRGWRRVEQVEQLLLHRAELGGGLQRHVAHGEVRARRRGGECARAASERT